VWKGTYQPHVMTTQGLCMRYTVLPKVMDLYKWLLNWCANSVVIFQSHISIKRLKLNIMVTATQPGTLQTGINHKVKWKHQRQVTWEIRARSAGGYAQNEPLKWQFGKRQFTMAHCIWQIAALRNFMVFCEYEGISGSFLRLFLIINVRKICHYELGFLRQMFLAQI
jgi:hypothetical protein